MSRNLSGDISLESDRGNITDSKDSYIGDVIELIDNNLSESELEKTFCLQFIDPYGNTTFNSPQTTVLIKEFELLFSRCQSTEEREKIKSIIEFISKAKDKVHTYIKFRGD